MVYANVTRSFKQEGLRLGVSWDSRPTVSSLMNLASLELRLFGEFLEHKAELSHIGFLQSLHLLPS